MDASGKTYGSPAGRSVEAFRDYMTLVKEYLDLKPKAEKGDAVAKVEFFIRALKMGDYKDLQSAAKHLSTLSKVSQEQKAKIDVEFINLEVADIAKPARENRDRTKMQELQAEAGKAFLAMHKKGRVPKPDSLFGEFYSAILVHAEVEKDIPVFEEALKLLEGRFPDAKGFFDTKRKVLERLKEEKAEK
jgi:hypothetical protein